MKRAVFFLFISTLFISAFPVYAQRLSTVGILPFEASGGGVSPADAAEVTRLVVAELSSWEIMTILSGEQANSAEYLVRGQIARQNNQIVLSAATSLASSGRTLNNSRAEGASLGAISMETFCAQIAENVPFPNYMLGVWQSTINMPDGPINCILEFRSDRTVNVRQYDTWEHNGTDSLKYQAIGNGTYTYAGYRRRTVTVSGRTIQADATVGVNLSLEDALTKYETVSEAGLRVLFNEARSSFELVSGALPCGDNFTGPSIYPSQEVFYTRFTKIQ